VPTRRRLLAIHQVLASQFGLDVRRVLLSLRGIPQFVRDLVRFNRGYAGRLTLMPYLHDRYEEAGATTSEYFWQDLLVARWVHEQNPARHVDIGSRVDGFVAHVASFRNIEVIDVRPIASRVPGVLFRQADVMQPATVDPSLAESCDSLSCLHALEHFGLGRYGDPIDPDGYRKGVANMARLLKPGGTLYLSTPIGRERVEFNANWVFDPRSILQCAAANGLTLERWTVIGSGTGPTEVTATEENVRALALSDYNLGIFVFKKADTH
jgi:hypothetical protein